MTRNIMTLAAGMVLALAAGSQSASAAGAAKNDHITTKYKCANGKLVVVTYFKEDAKKIGHAAGMRWAGKYYKLVAKKETARGGIFISKKDKLVWDVHFIGEQGTLKIGKKKLACDSQDVNQ